MSSSIPTTGTRGTLDTQVQAFLNENPDLHLGGIGNFHDERAHHTKVFGFHNIPPPKRAPIERVEHTAIPGPHGTIPIRVFYPSNVEPKRKKGEWAALIYFHGGGYTIGTVDEFEHGLRILAEEAGVQVYAVEYRLAPEWRFPTQLDEYMRVVEWVQTEGGRERGVDTFRVCGGGDSAGGNMTAAIALRLHDEDKKNYLKALMLYYPEARLPFDTPAATENNSGFYLECNGIFSFADHYLPRGTPPAYRYVSPGMQPVENLKGMPPTAVFTCGFDPLRDVGLEFAHKSQKAGNEVSWKHFNNLTHGFLQMCPWSEAVLAATKASAQELKRLAYG